MRAADAAVLMRDAAAGDERAFAALHRRYHAALVGWLIRQTGDRMVAEDVAQVAWVQVWRHAHRYDPTRGTVSHWLYAIARRRVWNHVRNERRRRSVWRTDAEMGGEEDRQLYVARSRDDPAEAAEFREAARRLGAAYAALPEHHRAAVHAYDVRGLDYYESAAELGCPLGTLRSRLSRARETLYAAIT